MLKNLKMPHTYVIIFYIIVIAAICTWVVPGGEFERQTKLLPDGSSKTIIVPGSFNYVDNSPQTWEVFSALYHGFIDKADIIIFILLIGGAFWIMNASKSIDVAIFSFLRFTKKLEKAKLIRAIGVNNIIITLIMLLFSIFGAVFGMSEETIAFVIIFVPLAVSMGYDSIMGVCLCFVAAGLGFAGAMLNPFTIGIAQGLSDVPLFTGIEYRFFCWVIINIVGIAFVLRYAAKIKKDPTKSLVFNEDKYWRDKSSESQQAEAVKTPISAWICWAILLVVMILFCYDFEMNSIRQTKFEIGGSSKILPIIPILTGMFAITGFLSLRKSAQSFILQILMFTIFFLIVGVMGHKWFIMEIATLFFVMGLSSGIAMNYSPNKITKLFMEGVTDIMGAAMVVGLAGGIIIILQEGKIIDTMLNSLSQTMNDVGKYGSISIMYVMQNLINIIIPSGSAKAALTMPIMAPFSDLIGVSRQATIMAYQFGDGFTNMITPTSGILIAVLGIAKIPYEKWVKWITPLMIILIVLGLLLLIPTVVMDLNGF